MAGGLHRRRSTPRRPEVFDLCLRILPLAREKVKSQIVPAAPVQRLPVTIFLPQHRTVAPPPRPAPARPLNRHNPTPHWICFKQSTHKLFSVFHAAPRTFPNPLSIMSCFKQSIERMCHYSTFSSPSAPPPSPSAKATPSATTPKTNAPSGPSTNPNRHKLQQPENIGSKTMN